MEIRTLDDWPFAVRCLVTYGQQLANEKVHAETSGAHVLTGLMAMPIVRKELGVAACEEIDKACTKAVMVSRRGGATTAILSQPIALLLFGTPQAPSTVPRTTASFLSGFLQGSMFLEKAAAALKARAEEIAKALDDPRLERMVTQASSAEVKALSAALGVGLAAASELQHQYFTARHVAYGALLMVDVVLKKQEKPRVTEPLERMRTLLERSVSKRGPKSNALVVHPRLFGAVALALSTSEDPKSIEAKVLAACLAGDPEIDFVREAIESARERMDLS